MNKEAKFSKEPLKAGTWIAYEYDVWMLKEDEGGGKFGEHTNISNGTVETWVNVREGAFPLTLRSRQIGEWFEYKRRELTEETRPTNLNWPDIHRHYCEQFRKCIEADNRDDVLKIQSDLTDFNSEIMRKVRDVGSVGGVKVFR